MIFNKLQAQIDKEYGVKLQQTLAKLHENYQVWYNTTHLQTKNKETTINFGQEVKANIEHTQDNDCTIGPEELCMKCHSQIQSLNETIKRIENSNNILSARNR